MENVLQKTEIVFMNLLTGEFNKPHKINRWFSDFLDSFSKTEYHAQATMLKPWQYKRLMKDAETNHWNMLSTKQWDIFCKYINFESAPQEEFANFIHNGRKFKIRISITTGFATITIE